MTDNEQALIEGIEKIANNPKVMDLCEPKVTSHKYLSRNDVLRVLYAQKLLLEEAEKK